MGNKKLKVASVWSGGKDGCLACYKAIQQGYSVQYLFNLISKRDSSVSFHNFNKDVVKMQSEVVNIPIFQRKICSQREEPETFEEELKVAFQALKKADDIEGLVFGYVLPGDYQRALVKRLCSELKLKLVEPLYERNSRNVLSEFINSGFKAVIVSANLTVLDSYWVGQLVNEDFIKYLESRPGVDICGDHGEYHTIVIDGPLFKKTIQIREASKLNTFNRCILNIHKVRLLKKC